MPIAVPTHAYCTVEDVLALLPTRQYDSESRPTLEQAEEIIKDVAREINGALRSLGYTAPLTGSSDIADLKTINKYGAAGLCESATLIGVQGESVLATRYLEQFKAMMKQLREGEWQFSDAGAPTLNNPDGNDDLDEGGDRDEPIFSISQESRETKF